MVWSQQVQKGAQSHSRDAKDHHGHGSHGRDKEAKEQHSAKELTVKASAHSGTLAPATRQSTASRNEAANNQSRHAAAHQDK